MVADRVPLLGYTPAELREFVTDLGEPGYRADQLFGWLHGKQADDFTDLTNLPLELRARLDELASIRPLEVVRRQVDSKDDTRKYLLRTEDGEFVESVMMAYERGRSVCISSQIGCRQGCTFCASTIGGATRNLNAAEIVAQPYAFARELRGTGERIASLVFMGMGEPLENYDNVVRALHLLHEPRGMNVGYRHMTVSTCGLVPGINRLADEGIPITLAISLHAPNDAVRKQLMPINRRYPVAELVDACRHYVESTGRRISFEYILIQGVNDSLQLADELARLLRGLLCHVNLIPLNPVIERPWKRPAGPAMDAFRMRLEQAGISTTLRRTLGVEIDAACGQLRRREMACGRKRGEGS